MGRSKIPVIISLVSLLAAAGSVVTLFSVHNAASKDESRLKAASYQEDFSAGQTPVALDPAQNKYHQAAEFAVDMKKVTALAVGPDDRIYVAGDTCFCRYSPSGRLEARTALTFEPTCLAISGRRHGATGRIYVGFADHVEVFNLGGSKEAIWQGVDQAHFTSIACSDDDVFIADAGRNAVQHFDSTGKLLSPLGENSPEHFAPAPNSPSEHFDLVVGLDELVYVVDRRECRIEGYDFRGKLERHWGQPSPAIEDFAGRNNPAQIAITEDGSFVTAEENPLRVKVYYNYNHEGKVAGEFESQVCGPEGTGGVVDLAADHQNRILILDGAARRVRIFEKNKTPKAKEKPPAVG
jgi:hypothetical protein